MCSTSINCNECLPGRYDIASNCEHTCPSQCITCTSANNCSKCETGKYGPACVSECITQCPDGNCDKDSGFCTYGCAVNQYWDKSAKICRFCKYRCSRCINFNQCTECLKPHYWGSACEKDCVGCSSLCDKDTGCPAECMDKYYRNETNNIFKCIRCPDSCKSCTSPTQCNVCETGYWGTACQYNCTGCKGVCNKDNGCRAGCQTGFFQSVIIPNGFTCTGCFEHCNICLNETDCLKCFEGYYPIHNKMCISCPHTCRNNTCNQFTGSCSDGCIDGYMGQQCETECQSNCLQCDMHNSDICIMCDIGFYGDNCNTCSMHCKQGIETQTCNEDNGTCKYGCNAGFWGTMCTELCSNRCQNLRCNETTGTCLDGCSAAYYGRLCELGCSPNCVKDSILPRLCNELDGSCQVGCSPGFYGINCSAVCSNCRNLVCFQQNGTCKFGCLDGFTGVNCKAETGRQNVY